MQREVIKWLQSLDLSYPVKNPRKDFANGFTAAEIVSRYAGPQYITMHSIGTGVSSDCRRDNWVQVHHALQRLRCRTISMALIESILRYQPNAAQTVLENMYEFFSKRALPMRTIDADGTHFIKPKDALASAVLLETTGEVPAGAITGAVGNATNAEEEAREGYIVATTVQECLALTANDDLAGGVRPFQQPRYAAATASSLVRVANHDRQQLELQQPKASPDEEEQRMRNTQIIGQHGMIQKAMRMSEKKVVMEETTATGKKKLRPVPLTTILRGRYASATIYSQKREKRQKEAEVAVEQANDNTIGAQRVNVNVMNDTLKVALERNGIHLRSEERAGEKSIEFFEQCDFNLRKAFSSLLKDVLAAHHDLYTLVELSGNNSESDVLEDLFTSVVAHRDVLSLETLRACWTALEQNIAGIAASVHARGSEYSYLIQSMNFIFSLEAAQVPTLHVSSSPILKESGDESNPRPLSVSLGGRPHNSIQSDAAATNPLNRNISSGVQRHRSQSIGARPPSHRFFPERRTPELRRQQAVLLDRQAFNIASAFVLLSRIQETLARHHPADALQTLTAYFLPAAKLALVPFGTPAVVEAMTRVIVMSVCGTEQLQTKSEIFTLPDGCTADVDVVVDDDMLESKRWRQEARLARFLALVIRPFLIDSATTTGSLVVSPVDSKGSSYTQIVSPAASVELVSRKSSFYQRASTRPQASAPSIHSEQRYYLFMYHTLCHYQQIREEDESISLRHWQMQSAYPLAQLASNAVDQCLSRELPGTRAIGLGLLSWLMAADGWVHALRHLPRGVLEPVMTAVSGSDLRSSDARLWELRILALDLLTLLFQKWMIIHKEEHDYEMKRTEAAAVAEGAGSHMDYSHSSISNSREMGSAEVRRNTVAMEPPRCASSMLSQYERLSDAIAAVVSPMDLERATERTLSTFLHAPPSHRQLALTVIGSRLLPDEQPRVAKLWLRCLLAVPTKTLRLCLLPFEKEPLEMKVRSAPVNGMNPVVPVPASSPSKQGKGGSVVLPPISPNPNMSASIGHFNNTTATLGAGGSMTPVMLKVARAAVSGFAERSNMECSELSGEGSSSISFVVGKVEPSYKVAPLNQTWDTHSVVQVVLRNLRTIQPYQVLSTVAAALLSPQGLDVQHAQLLHNLSVSEGVTPSMVDTMERPSSHQRSSSQDGTKHDDLELEDDDLAVTLHDLVHTARVPDGSSMADSYSVPVRPTNESVEELSRCFWLSVLHRLLPIISTAIAPPPPPTKNNVEFPLDGTMSYLNRTDNTVTTASSHCFNDDVDPATLSEVAQAVLFTLFQRYAPEEEITAAVSDTREVLPRAFQWAQMTLDSA